MKYIPLLLLCFTSFAVKSQKLSLDKLKALIYQPVEFAADTLQKGGWTVRPELSGKQADQLYQTFSYGNLADEQAKALAWLRIHADNGKINQLYYQTPGQEQYNLLLQEIKKLGTEKKDPDKMAPGIVSTYYVSSYYTYQTIVGKDSYTVMVTTNNVK
jgi:hypothetical protein